MVKAFNLPIEYVLYEMSYINTILYCATLPSYDTDNNKKDDKKYNGDDKSTNDIIKQLAFTST